MAGVAMLACFTPTSLGAAVAGDGGWRRRNADSAMSPLLSQSSCFTSSYTRLRGKERARQLSMSTQYVLNGASRSPSASFLGLSDRIASSQYCSCSTSLNINSASLVGKGKREQIEGPFSVKRRKGSKVLAGLKQVNMARGVPELSRPWTRRRRGQSVLQAGRKSENVDVGGFKFETKAGGVEGDGKVGENGDLAGLVKKIGEVVGGGDGEESSDEESEEDSPFSWMTNIVSKRWSIVIMCFFAFLLCNMDRVNMSIAVLPMQTEYHWSSTTVGLVQSSFFWGYLLTQVAGGIWADSIGGKQVLGFGVIWWSLATIATPIAAKIGLPALFFVRACMGVGEGVAMPAMNNLLSRWIPVQERSRALAFVYSGMYLGSVIGLACSPSLIQRFGWPSVFFSFGSVGAIWFTIWQRNAYSSPSEDPKLSEGERKLILKGNKPKEPITRIPWGLLLSKAPVWALIVCHFCHNWGTFILLTWMPTYYNQVLGFNLMESGLLSVLPWLTMAISANVGGWIADTLVGKGYSVTAVRKIMQTIGFLGPAFFLTQLSHVTSAPLAVMCMMACQGTDAFSQAGLYSNHQDIGPRYSGILLGLSNTAGVLAGVFGTAATGYILQHGTWDDVFRVAVGLYIFGTIIWNFFATGEQLFE